MKRLVAAVVVAIGGAATMAATQVPPAGASPPARVVALPYFPGANAIWGATGQDARGHIWFGISSGPPYTAHLYEYVPETGVAADRGNVVDELKRAGVWREGEAQEKIHSKIVQAADGLLYFASMNESDEDPNGSRLPTWGGHLWRRSIRTGAWEHLLRAPEALIAVGAGGQYVYALGYFGHVLYQVDIRSKGVRRAAVGSVDGHISRNFVVDARGHAFVPRLTTGARVGEAAGPVTVALVEFDTALREVHATPLDGGEYFGGRNPTESHGIVGLLSMPDGSVFFSTDRGRVFRVRPPAAPDQPAHVSSVGWMHPEGPSYAASLFSPDGAGSLASLVRRSGHPFEWVRCHVASWRCDSSVFVVAERDAAALNRTLLYGSATRDARGAHYLAGMGNDYRPLVVRVDGR